MTYTEFVDYMCKSLGIPRYELLPVRSKETAIVKKMYSNHSAHTEDKQDGK